MVAVKKRTVGQTPTMREMDVPMSDSIVLVMNTTV